jgi:hypothetical protein
MKAFRLSLAALLVLGLTVPCLAGGGNGAPTGKHFNLNIIGVDKAKTAPMTGSNRHSIFVGLGGKGGASVTSKIFLTPGDFQVCDGNAFDAAFDCDGNQVQNVGAVFQIPCNTNIILDGAEVLVPCAVREKAAYEVWARALGKPGGEATMTTCAWDPDLQEEVCSTESVFFVRETGKSTFKNVTQELTSLRYMVWDAKKEVWVDTRVSLFSGGLEDWFWNYDNNGLRLAQLRFYLLD